ncbi:DUF4256 domain-containing protein [Pontibacter russatus]
MESRKQQEPENCAVGMATAIGIELLTDEQDLELQQLGSFNTETSSWVKTPAPIQKLGGLFCDRRYDIVFMSHKGLPGLPKR